MNAIIGSIILLAIGVMAGFGLCKLYYSKPDMNVEDAIALLKSKGYYINIKIFTGKVE